METVYRVDGMTCQGCVASVKNGLLSVPGVTSAEVDLEESEAKVVSHGDLALESLQAAIGKFRISKSEIPTPQAADILSVPSVQTYRPLIMIVSFIAGVSLLAQYPFEQFSGMIWMRHFMAGFFIVFAFFKLLNLRGFAENYRMYDIVAARWYGWGFVYPFIELALGTLYLINIAPLATNVATIVVLGISSVGVIESNLNKRKIKCACLGDVFNLPMSTVTIIEDLGMVGMAVAMVFAL